MCMCTCVCMCRCLPCDEGEGSVFKRRVTTLTRKTCLHTVVLVFSYHNPPKRGSAVAPAVPPHLAVTGRLVAFHFFFGVTLLTTITLRVDEHPVAQAKSEGTPGRKAVEPTVDQATSSFLAAAFHLVEVEQALL